MQNNLAKIKQHFEIRFALQKNKSEKKNSRWIRYLALVQLQSWTKALFKLSLQYTLFLLLQMESYFTRSILLLQGLGQNNNEIAIKLILIDATKGYMLLGEIGTDIVINTWPSKSSRFLFPSILQSIVNSSLIEF